MWSTTETTARWSRLRGLLQLAAVVACGLMVTGCGRPGTPPRQTVPVSGTVTLMKAPVPFATIEFASKAGRDVQSAEVIDGKFQFPAEHGLPPGEYHVRILPYEAEIEAFQKFPADKQRAIVAARKSLPKGYTRDGALAATISNSPPNELTFDLRP